MLDPADVASKAEEAARSLSETLGAVPPAVVVLGTGWDVLAKGYATLGEVEFTRTPGFEPASAPGHRGAVKLIDTRGGPLLVQEGRLHCYEGYSALEATFPIWAYHALGVKAVVLMSAAGGLNPVFLPGDLMLVRDHMCLFGANPLAGVPHVAGCDPFIVAADFYPEQWQDTLQAAVPAHVRCERGVYAYATGPSFETASEASFLRIAGADAVGMSTAPEAIIARYLGMTAGAMCCITNLLLPCRAGATSPEGVHEVVAGTASALDGFLDSIATSASMIG
jgi:purine-nucleoside phosphorylase